MVSLSQSQSSTQRDRMDYPAAGSVARIQVVNFMCHDNLEVKLNPRINFICGSNGSGKSAIQTAIAVGLGGKAISTNRGNSVKSLIQNGKNTCHITVVLNNMGPLAFSPQEYGRYIQVDRSFSHTTQGYKIKNASGNVVSIEKKELDRIVDHFGIQTDNPVCILHQDVARNFLATTDSKLIYKFYQKSSRFDDIEQIYFECRARNLAIREKADDKYQALCDAFKDFLDLKKKLKIMEETAKKAAQRDHLKNELVWAKVNEDSKELQQLITTIEEVTATKNRIEQKLSESGEDSLKDRLSELQQNVIEIDEQAAEAREKIGEARTILRAKKDKFADKVQEYNESKNRAKLNKKKYESCLEVIENLAKNAPEKKIRQEQCKAEIADLERQLERLSGVDRTVANDWQQLAGTVERDNAAVSAKRAQLTDIQLRKRKKEGQLKELTASTSSLAVYGHAMVRIVEDIERAFAQGRFVKKPLGPIGKHIKVRDPSWAGAVENYLGKGLLSSFYVDNSKDFATLNKMLKTACTQYNVRPPNIYCSKFLNKAHNIREVETGTRDHASLARMLAVDHPDVFNCLVDQLEMECVLLIDTNEHAYDLLDEVHKVPRFCKKAFTKTGDKFFPAPNYKSYSNDRPLSSTLLQANQADLITQLTEEIKQLGREVESAKSEQAAAERQAGRTREAITANEAEQRNVKRQRANVEIRIRKLHDELEPESQTNLSYLQQEADELREQLVADTQRIQKLREEVEQLKEEEGSAKEAYDSLQKKITDCDEAKAPLQRKMQQMNIKISEASGKTNMMRRKMAEWEEKLTEMQEREAELSEALTQSEQSASQSCDRVRTKRTTKEIQRQLKNLEEYLKRMEIENGGTLETLKSGYEAREKAFETVQKDIDDIKSMADRSSYALDERKAVQSQMQSLMGQMVRNHFGIYLSERNFSGRLRLDFEAGTMELNVAAQGSQNASKTSSLSGGEKSFSTVSLIMAIWSVIPLPFHFLDEFDVFMDGVNRRTVVDLLVSHASRTNSQFVFLTPLDMSFMQLSDITSIHRLENPRD